MRGFKKHKNAISKRSAKAVLSSWWKLISGGVYKYENEKARRVRQIQKGIIPKEQIMEESV
jgi:hypothetical protein